MRFSTAEGELDTSPTLVWYREVKEPTAQLEDVAQLFLGQRIQCARCHHHPLEKWSQQDYYGLAAFFSRLEIKDAVPPKKGKKGKKGSQTTGHAGQALPRHLQARQGRGDQPADEPEPVRPAGLGGPELDIAPNTDPRRQLADWLTAKDNSYFARALVNRYWKHFLGRGLVDPEDDLRVTNPPSNAELLDALAKHFIEHNYDLKDLVRTICTSQVYRLSVEPNAYNAGDTQNFSRFLPRRLSGGSAARRHRRRHGVEDGVQGRAGLDASRAAAGQPIRVLLPQRLRPARLGQRLRVRTQQRCQPGSGAAPVQLRGTAGENQRTKSQCPVAAVRRLERQERQKK